MVHPAAALYRADPGRSGPDPAAGGPQQAIGVVLAIVFLCSAFWILGWLLFVFITLIVATLRRNFEAGLLLIPLLLSGIGAIEPVLTAGMSDWSGRPTTRRSPCRPVPFPSTLPPSPTSPASW